MLTKTTNKPNCVATHPKGWVCFEPRALTLDLIKYAKLYN